MLEQIRVLVQFLRNRTWRMFLKRATLEHAIPAVLFEHFQATIAKWRYETIPICMRALDRWRHVLYDLLQEAWFENTQDKEFLKSVFKAAKDREMWIFISACLRYIFWPCEEHRRWGMTCLCTQHIAD